VTFQNRGKFITIEGLDGCGKSTQLRRLAEVLRGEGIEVVETREPGGTPIGDAIRALLLDSRTKGMSPWTELTLMFASRAQQIDELILPSLRAGKWVLCDRFTDSSEAYQGGGRGLGTEAVLRLHEVICRDLQPDLTIYMDSDVEHSVNRARRRNQRASGAAAGDENRFEQESRAFFERVQEAFRAIAKREPERVVTFDARRPADVVHPQIVAAVRKRLM
jgi:dTMP kinase